MRLHKAATTASARHVIDHGFVGVPQWVYAEDDLDMTGPGTEVEYVEFRDLPPAGMTLSRTAEVETAEDDDEFRVRISGGAVLADFIGDFILTIEVPDDVAREYRITEEPPAGWPFQEFWLPPALANQYLGTLRVYGSEDGEEVRPDLVGK